MDIKTLLLESLSLDKPLGRSHRIYYGKSCFIVRFEMNGKFLHIKSIKNTRKRTTWAERIKYYSRHSRILRSKANCVDQNTCNRTFGDIDVQTEDVQKHSKEAQTEAYNTPITTEETSTQTIDVKKNTEANKTPVATEETSTQTIRVKKNTEAYNTPITTEETSTQTIDVKKNTETYNTPITTEETSTQTISVKKYNKGVQTEKLKFDILKNLKDVCTQTVAVEKYKKEIKSEILKFSPAIKKISKLPLTRKPSALPRVQLTSTAQQTITSIRFRRCTTLTKCSISSQTDFRTESKGIQCKKYTHAVTTNTDVNARDSSTQTENDSYIAGNAPESTKNSKTPMNDFEVLIYMLNEVGDIVVNQNRILNDNTEMLRQIMDSNEQRIPIPVQISWSEIPTQTDALAAVEKKNNFSQTVANSRKCKKLLLFKGRNSQDANT